MKRRSAIKKEEEVEVVDNTPLEKKMRLSHDEILHNFVPDVTAEDCLKYQCLFQVVLSMQHHRHHLDMWRQKEQIALEQEKNLVLREQNALLQENRHLRGQNA